MKFSHSSFLLHSAIKFVHNILEYPIKINIYMKTLSKWWVMRRFPQTSVQCYGAILMTERFESCYFVIWCAWFNSIYSKPSFYVWNMKLGLNILRLPIGRDYSQRRRISKPPNYVVHDPWYCQLSCSPQYHCYIIILYCEFYFRAQIDR